VPVGTDRDGDEETTRVVVLCNVVKAAAPKTAKASRPPKAVTVALRALREALDSFGAIPLASNYIPPHTKTVDTEHWLTFAYKFGISTGEERAQQQAFKRAFEHLTSSGEVALGMGRYGFQSNPDEHE
jgi:hypothetical protein